MASDFITKIKSKYDEQGLEYQDRGNYITTRGIPLGTLANATNQVGFAPTQTNTPVTNATVTNANIPNVTDSNAQNTPFGSTNINSLYANRINSATGDIEARKQGQLGQLDREQEGIAPLYYDERRKATATSDINARNMNEFLAARGLSSGGASVQSAINRGSSLQGNLGNINARETAAFSDIENRRTEVERLAGIELSSKLSELEAMRMQDVIDEERYQRELALAERKYQDQMTQLALDNQRQAEVDAYNREQDALDRSEYADRTAYSREQDALNRADYEAELEYSRGQDALSDETLGTQSTTSQWNASDALLKGAKSSYALGNGKVVHWSSPEQKYDMIANRYREEFKQLLGDEVYARTLQDLQGQLQSEYDTIEADEQARLEEAQKEADYAKSQTDAIDKNVELYASEIDSFIPKAPGTYEGSEDISIPLNSLSEEEFNQFRTDTLRYVQQLQEIGMSDATARALLSRYNIFL